MLGSMRPAQGGRHPEPDRSTLIIWLGVVLAGIEFGATVNAAIFFPAADQIQLVISSLTAALLAVAVIRSQLTIRNLRQERPGRPAGGQDFVAGRDAAQPRDGQNQ